MKTTIPQTSQTQYITGSAALNIPDETGDAADWHFCEHFLNENNLLSIPVAGVNFMSTTHILGDYGVHECSESLKRQGVYNINGTVYAANAVRAVLDLALRHICERGSSPEHIDANEYLADSEQFEALNSAAERACGTLKHKQASLLRDWMKFMTVGNR